MSEETKSDFVAPSNEEFQKMSPAQQKEVLNQAMEAVQKTYIENKLESGDPLLTKIQSAIESKGFNFYPHALCKSIDTEAERQFEEMIKDIIKGVPPKKLNEMKTTIIKWYNEEEERFEKYRSNFMEFARPPVMSDSVPTFVHQENASSAESAPVSETNAEEVKEEEKVLPMKKKVTTKKK